MERPLDGIGLADALEALRQELASAHAKAAEQDVQFPINALTVQLQVGLTRSQEGNAGFRVPLVGAQLGGSTGSERETWQTVILELGAPVDRLGNPLKVASAGDELKE